MCAINVLFNIEPDKLREYLQNAWEILKFRGEDGYGIVGQIDNRIIVAKSQDNNKVLNKLNSISGKFKWVIAHNRKASVGSINLDLTHPIVHEDKKLIVVHNGTNRDLFDVVKYAQSDTDAILHVYDLIKDPMKIDFIVNNIGVYFIVDIERKKILFYRDSLRTLYIEKKSNVLVSEPIFNGEWALIKEQLFYVDFDEFSPDVFEKEEYKNLTFTKTGLCSVCNKNKPLTNKDKCGDCTYQNKAKKNLNYSSNNYSAYSYYKNYLCY